MIGEPIDGCGLPPPPEVPLLPGVSADLPLDVCETPSTVVEEAPGTTIAPDAPSMPDPTAPVGLPPPPAPSTGGCRAVDPGTPTCTFDATGWIELDVFVVMAHAGSTAGGGTGGGFAGAGYDPPQRFGAVLPASPGDRVVVRASGWVVARPHRSA